MTPLDRRTVVVTRPLQQSEKLCELIQQQGGQTVIFPTIEIVAQDSEETIHTLDHLDRFQIAIFISANAVRAACAHVAYFPPTLKVAAVGKASALALQAEGVSVDIFPQDEYNSEALLSLPAMQSVQGQNIVIFRGNGGREFLADTLRQRGAQVSYVECYRREKPSISPEPLLQLWKNNKLDVIVVTSNEGLQNLYDMVGDTGRPYLLKTPLVLVSRRGEALARQLGFTGALQVADKADDRAIVTALQQWSDLERLD